MKGDDREEVISYSASASAREQAEKVQSAKHVMWICMRMWRYPAGCRDCATLSPLLFFRDCFTTCGWNTAPFGATVSGNGGGSGVLRRIRLQYLCLSCHLQSVIYVASIVGGGKLRRTRVQR